MFCKYISYKSNCSFSFLDINTKSKKLLNYIKTSQVWTIDFNHAYNVCLDACNPPHGGLCGLAQLCVIRKL